jgi:ATP-dependent DNA helicase DinG
VDVPGESLRLVVMERVPWPRPTVLHAARRMAGGGSAYDDRVVRARLAQAFGRLIRRQGDRGLFVVLSAAFPSRLLPAFPAGVPVRRVPLDQAIARVEQFLPGTGGWQNREAGLTEGTTGRLREVLADPPPAAWDEL